MERIGATIAKNRKAAGLSQGELAERLKTFGFNPSVASVSSWEKDVSIPNALQFLAVCKVLDIKNIYGEFEKEETSGENLFEGLNEEGRKKAAEYISLLLLSEEFREKREDTEKNSDKFDKSGKRDKIGKIKRAEKTVKISETRQSVKTEKEIVPVSEIKRSVRILKLYNLPASAGTGEFLDGEDYTEVEVGDEVSMAADFGIRIKGNSMEPRYNNGQTVWIKRCESLENGEIGIFFLNGNAYCKKLQKSPEGVSLISLNPDYKPINIREDDELAIFGKVLN